MNRRWIGRSERNVAGEAPGRRRCGRAPFVVLAGGVLAVVVLAGLPGCSTSSSRTNRHDGGGGAPAALPSGSSEHEIVVDGATRTYRTYVPAVLDTSESVPLVVMLHGGFGSARQAESAYGWDAAADAEGFVVVYPDGEGRSWNAGTCCGGAARDDVDDVGFIGDVVSEVGRRMPVDSRRTYVTGMSNGAMMALRLACETSTFAAVAPVAGAVMVPCEGPDPISVLQLHGTADDRVPMDGSPGQGAGKVPAHTPVAESIARWRVLDRCGEPSSGTDGAVTTSSSECEEGRTVTLVTVEGAGHQWPGASKGNARLHELIGADPPSTAIDATSTIWAFFAAHPAPA